MNVFIRASLVRGSVSLQQPLTHPDLELDKHPVQLFDSLSAEDTTENAEDIDDLTERKSTSPSQPRQSRHCYHSFPPVAFYPVFYWFDIKGLHYLPSNYSAIGAPHRSVTESPITGRKEAVAPLLSEQPPCRTTPATRL